MKSRIKDLLVFAFKIVFPFITLFSQVALASSLEKACLITYKDKTECKCAIDMHVRGLNSSLLGSGLGKKEMALETRNQLAWLERFYSHRLDKAEIDEDRYGIAAYEIEVQIAVEQTCKK